MQHLATPWEAWQHCTQFYIESSLLANELSSVARTRASNAPAIGAQLLRFAQSPWTLSTTLLTLNSLETAADINQAQQQYCQALLQGHRLWFKLFDSFTRPLLRTHHHG